MKKLYSSVLVSLFLLLGICPAVSAAITFDNLVVFGDSLSDTGNIYGVRFTNANLWVETLAQTLDADLDNNAYAGATTGNDNPAAAVYGYGYTGLQWQVGQYDYSVLTGTTLATVWAGANDFSLDRGYLQAAQNIITALTTLYSKGIRYFMVPNLPDIGNTPDYQDQGQEAVDEASLWTTDFNSQLADMLAVFAADNTDAVVYELDIYAEFDSYTVGEDDWKALFWTDGYHPSSAGHQVIAGVAASAVPVPRSALLLAAGLFGLALAGQKRQNEA